MESIPRTSGIYQILCIPTGKIYIGSAANLCERWYSHRASLRGGYHHNNHLQRAWNKHGEMAFQFEVIELVLLSFILEREQYWLDRLRPYGQRGFNLSPTASSVTGSKRSPETLARMRAAHIGKPHKKWTPEQRASLSALKKGRRLTPEHSANIRRGKQGTPPSEATIQAVITANSKCYIVTSPDGVEYAITGLSRFCREHELTATAMGRVAKGRSMHHKGWKCRLA